MLNHKQAEAADMVSDLQRATKQIRDMDVESMVNMSTSSVEKSIESASVLESASMEATNESVPTILKEETDSNLNKNEKILLLYKEGKDEVEIAKALDCGLGEVRLVLGLYHEA